MESFSCCKSPKIYLLQESDEGMEDKVEQIYFDSQDREDTQPATKTENKLEISFNAITNTPNPKTIRLRGRIGDKMVIILVDLGSTHNFLDHSIAKKAKLSVESTRRLTVKVANRVAVSSEGYY